MKSSARGKGLVQVYTGSGKGKTTAAWGQALRAIGRGRKVAIVQFLKTPATGERIAAQRLSPDLAVFGMSSPYDPSVDQQDSPVLREESRRNLQTARDLLASGMWDMVVLDEINIVLHYGFVSEKEMRELLDSRPERTELVLTGRYAPDWLVEAADLVTEMREIKHPSAEGVKARKGIEY